MTSAITAVIAAISGLGFGTAFFAMMRRTAGLFAAGSRWTGFGLTVARIGAAIVGFGVAARFGALPLLAAFAGFLIARTLALRAARKMA